MLVYRRDMGAHPQFITAISTGDLPHGIWGSGDGSRVYVGLENGDAVQAIDTSTNKIIATIPVGQLPQALVYVPDATTSDEGTANLKPLGSPATDALHIEMVPPAPGKSQAHASIAVNSLGLIDALQLAATGLEPGKPYRLVLTGNGDPLGLVAFKAGIGGAAIAQTLGPLKRVVAPFGHDHAPTMRLEIRAGEKGDGEIVLQQK